MKSVLKLSKHNRSFKLPFTPSPLVKSQFFYIQTAGVIHTKGDYCVVRSRLDSLLFLFVLKGSGGLFYRGREYELSRGWCAAIDCLEPHRITSSEEDPMVFCFLHFNGLQSRDYMQAVLEGHPGLFGSPENERILGTIRKVILALKRGTPHIEILSAGWIHSCLIELLLLAGVKFHPHDVAPDPVKRVLSYVEEHYAEELSLEDLAGVAALSKYHFSRVFKEHTGQAPYDFLLTYRLNTAKGLLINTRYQVGEIAERSGFQDLSHFNRSFKSHENMTPLEYRRHYRTEN